MILLNFFNDFVKFLFNNFKKISFKIFKNLIQVNNELKWASRWDYILESMPHTKIHWFR